MGGLPAARGADRRAEASAQGPGLRRVVLLLLLASACLGAGPASSGSASILADPSLLRPAPGGSAELQRGTLLAHRGGDKEDDDDDDHGPPGGQACPRSHGYWKTHPQAWPLQSIVLGARDNPAHGYTQGALLTLLKSPSHGDASLILAHQLIAARLNVAAGTNPAPIAAILALADRLLGKFPGKLPYGVKAGSSTGLAMVASAGWLDWYNNGRVPGSCGTGNRPPTAHAGPDQTVAVGSVVTLNGSASSDPDGNPLTFRWAFTSKPAASAAQLSDPRAVMPTFVVDRPGTYELELVVNDGAVDSAPDTVRVSTLNSRPLASAGPDQTVVVGRTVQLDGSASSDPDRDTLTFSWSIVAVPAGSAAALSAPTTAAPTFVADRFGDYVVQLVVSDGVLSSLADTVRISTENSPPVASAGPDQTAFVGDTLTLNGSGSTDVDGHPLTFSWSFTTTPPGSVATLSDPTSVNPTFVLDAGGVYVVQLIVNDGFVDSVADTVAVTTLNSPPVANAGPDQVVFVGATVQLNGSGSTDVDGNPLTFAWSLTTRPAGSAATLSDPTAVMPTFVVDVPGLYVAQLVVHDGAVNGAADTVAVSTQNRAPVANAGPDQSVALGATAQLDGSGSSDPDGDELTFAWSLLSRPADSGATLANAATATPTFVVDRPGSYVAQLVVGDGQAGSAPDTVTISTQNSIPIANAGPDQSVATGATVQLDGSGSSDPDGAPLQFAWSLLSRPAGSAATLSSAGIVNPTFVADRAGVYVAQLIVGDGLLVSTPDTVTITVEDAVDLRITFQAVPVDPPVGVVAAITVDVTNPGPLSVGGVTARFQVPAGYTVSSATPLTGGTYDLASGTWTIGDIAIATLERLAVIVVPRPTGPYDLTATITGSSRPDPNLANNTASATVTPNANADLRIEFAGPPTTPPVGSFVALSLALTNLGPAAVTGATADFRVPAGYTVESVNLSPGSTYDSATGTWTTGPIGPPFAAELVFGARVNATGPYDLTATITSSSQPDPNLANNTVTATVTPNADADIGIAFDSFPTGTVGYGATVALTVHARNNGPARATGVTARIQVPAGYTISSVFIPGAGSFDAATGTWTVGTLSSFGGAAIVLGLAANTAPGPLTLTAAITGSSQPDPNLANNTVTAPPANRPPIAEAGPDQAVATGTAVSLDGRESRDPDGDSFGFRWEFALRPASSTATLAGATTATPSFTPDLPGPYQLRLTLTDSLGAAGAPDVVTITAGGFSRPPVILSSPVTAGAVGQPYRYDVEAIDPDAGNGLTFSLTAAPAGMTIDPATGLIQWTPAETQAGPQDVAARVQDQRGLAAAQSFAVQVSSAANQAPVATDDAYEVRFGEALSIGAPGVLGNDTDADGQPLRATLLTPPDNGTVLLDPDGSFLYTPDGLREGDLVTLRNVNLATRVPGVVAAANVADDDLGTSHRVIFQITPFTDIVFPVDVTVTELQLFGHRDPFLASFRATAGFFQLFDAAGTEVFNSGAVDLPLPDRDARQTVPTLGGVRRARFTITESGPGESGFADFKVIGSVVVRRVKVTEPDLARLLPTAVRASSVDAHNTPESAIDDNPGTNWYAATHAAGAFLELVFPVDVTVTQVSTRNPSATPQGFGSSIGIDCNGSFTLHDVAGTVLFDSGVVHVPFGGVNGGGLFTLPVPGVAGVRQVRYTSAGCAGTGFPVGFSELKVLGTASVPTPAFNLARKFQALVGREVHSTPLVINLTDDNFDGVIDTRDIPDIVVPVESLGNPLTGEIKVISGDSGRELFTAGAPSLVSPWAEAAAGDLDGDGRPDIVAVHSDGNHLIAFDHTGALKWISDANAMPRFVQDTRFVGGAVSIVNLDATGPPEIVVGASVFSADGRLLGDGRTLGGTTGGTGLRSAISAVVDLDLDGVPELVAGPTAYRLVNGVLTKVWQRTDRPDGYVAIGNFDDDPFPEIVVVANGQVYLLNHDGTDAEVWNPPAHGPVPLPGGGQGGAPTVADLDGDGVPEIGVAGAANYVVFNRDGTVRWTSAISDRSSNSTGSTVFDFDGDGSVEVVYRDELFLRVYRGSDGVLLAKTPIDSSTWAELPVVADVDNDGHADIVVTSDRLGLSSIARTGVHVFHDVANQWARTRRIWNQHGYHVTNVNEDGTIPPVETANWLVPGLNNFRLNAFLPGESGDAADQFTYQASDGTLASSVATVHIAIRAVNSAPRITSAPGTAAATAVPYSYAAQATDPDAGDVLTFSLATAPAGMTIDPPSGLVRWTPAAGQLGRHDVVVRVQDVRGLFALQPFAVQVTSPVTVPNVVGESQAAATAAITGATLAVGPITTRHSATTPAGAVVSQNPGAGILAAPGSAVSLVVSLGPPPVGTVPGIVGLPQASAQADIAAAGFVVGPVTGQPSTVVPVGQVISQNPAAGTQAAAGSAVSLVVSLGPPPGDVDLDGDGLTGNQGDCDDTDPSVRPGAVDVAGNGIDENCNGRDSIAGDDTPPTASIDSPAEDAVITLPTDIVGSVTDANFLRYTLEQARVNDPSFTRLASGTTPVTSGVLGRLDPTLLENGMYRVRLTVEDVNGQTSVVERVYRVAGEAKIGVLALSFIDLQVPVSGIPITVIRSYDSRVKTQRDFGIGWSLQVKTGTYQNNRRPGDGWTVTRASGPFGLPCTVTTETRSHSTELRLSDREFYLFRPQLTNLAAVVGGCVGRVAYEFVDGVLPGARLEVLGNADIIYTSGDQITEFDGTEDTGLVFDPRRVRLITADGRIVDFDREAGITRIQDANGNGLSITPAGIVHSSGKSIAFARDDLGRIVRITDPNGHRLDYGYDDSGDLTEFVDQARNRTAYVYDDRHNLVEIHDPVGNRAFRGEYDSDGRLIAFIDGKGQRIAFAHDVSAREEVITDARGNVRRLAYDPFGNIQAEQRAVTIAGSQVLATWTYVSDALGNELVAVDPDGVRAESSYDHTNLLDEVVDPQGLALRTRRTYDAGSRPLSITNPAGEATSVLYDARGNLRRWSEPSGSILELEHDPRGRLTQRADAAGAVTRTTRDDSGNVLREEQTDSAGTLLSRRDHTYDGNNNRLTETVFRTVDGILRGFTTTFTYDALNRVVAVRDPAGNVSRTEYNALGLEAAAIDALGRRTQYAYDEVGALIRTDFPDGTSETRGYDASGNLIQLTDGAGRTTHFEYDELNRLIVRIAPDGTTTQRVYSAGGRPVAEIDGRGNRTDFGYDAAGRLTRVTLPEIFDAVAGIFRRPEKRFELDAAGRQLAIVDPNGARTESAYDAGGRLVRTTYADGTTRTMRYDALSQVVEEQDEAGRRTLFEYDSAGRLAAVTDPAAGRTVYRYDELGNRLSRTDALGRATRYRYDTLNRLIETTLPGGEREASAYDAVGNLISRTDFNGNRIDYANDPMNRVTRKSFPDGTAVTYTYTPTGQRRAVTDSRGTTSYEYDANDRLTRITQPAGEVVTHAYDGNGQLRQVSTPAGAVDYEYDALNRLARAVAPIGETRFGYDGNGNLVRVAAANGVISHRSYDARNRLTELRHTVGSGTLRSFAYQLSPTGRRLRVTEVDGAVESYAYDALDRLISEVRIGASPRTISYEYDGVGNRTRMLRNDVPTAYAYDVNDRLLAAGSTGYTYDRNGNVVSRSTSGSTVRYAWDFENRLTRVEGPTGATHFTYDADGYRVARQTESELTHFLVDASNPTGFAQVLEERDGAGGLLAHYTYGSRLYGMTRTGTPSFHLSDGLGSIRLLADAAGVATDTYEYDAYGNPIATTGSTANPYLFAGEQFEPELGFYNLRARWMDPATGRFLSRDPFSGIDGDPRTQHPYGYASGDPVNLVDPSGYLSMAEVFQVVAAQGNLARQSLALLNAYRRADSIAEIIELVWGIGSSLPYISRLLTAEYGGPSTVPLGGTGASHPTADGAVRRIAAALRELDIEDALIKLTQNLPRLTGRTVIAWAPTLLDDVRPRDLRSLALYLPNPVAIPRPVAFPTPIRARIGRRVIPVQAVLGGGDIGRLVGAGLNARPLGGLRQVWAMDFDPLTTFGSRGPVDGQWTDFPYSFRVLRPPQ